MPRFTHCAFAAMTFATLSTLAALTGCVTTTGTYKITATTKEGRAINVQTTAFGRGIYTVRNAVCSEHPGATVKIVDSTNGKELTSESPYQCK